MVGGSEELDNYAFKARGISRTELNIIAFIGMFIFGWLIAVVFNFLGKQRHGWLYLVPIIFIGVGLSNVEPAYALLATVIYIVAWVHANVVLSRYQVAARRRISEIERETETPINTLLEKGILLQKVLRDKEAATDSFTSARSMPGGDPRLLNLAGLAISSTQRYREASEFLDRAAASAKDDALVKQIKKNQKFVAKKLK